MFPFSVISSSDQVLTIVYFSSCFPRSCRAPASSPSPVSPIEIRIHISNNTKHGIDLRARPTRISHHQPHRQWIPTTALTKLIAHSQYKNFYLKQLSAINSSPHAASVIPSPTFHILQQPPPPPSPPHPPPCRHFPPTSAALGSDFLPSFSPVAYHHLSSSRL